MKKIGQWALLLLVLLLTATGAALPYAVSALQDSTVEALRESRTLNEVNLTLQTGEDVQEVLRLLASSTSQLDWQGKTELTAGEAAAAAEEAMRLLDESGLTVLLPEIEEYEYSMHVEPDLIMSMDESSLSAVVWICWPEEMPYNWVFIDDKTGKMVRAFLSETQVASSAFRYGAAANVSSLGENAALEAVVQQADSWRSFLSKYYGTELVFADEASEDAEIYDADYREMFSLLFNSEDWKDSGTLMRLELRGTAVYFNS